MAVRRRKAVLLAALGLVVAWSWPGALQAVEAPHGAAMGSAGPAGAAEAAQAVLRRRGPVDLGKLGGPDDGTPAPPPHARRPLDVGAQRAPAPRRRPSCESLDGKRVHIGGYVVPLDFDATRVKEFLLVPFVGACIHVPPPPANQIIYVKVEQGFDVQGTFDPVWVTGTLKVTPTFTGLADAGYSLEAEKVEPRPGG